MQTHVDRHVQGMLQPESDEEKSIARIFGDVVVLADRYRGDKPALAGVVMIASGLMRLAGDNPPGRIDPTLLNKQVRDALMRAGVEDDNL